MHKFSDKDYAAIEATAERIFKAVGGKDIAKKESCRYIAPEVYSNIALFCGFEIAAYLPYESNEQAVALAKALERDHP